MAITKRQIDDVLERVREWPPSRQEDAARLLLALEEQSVEPYVLSIDERADLDQALEEIERGEVASDDDVATVLNKYR